MWEGETGWSRGAARPAPVPPVRHRPSATTSADVRDVGRYPLAASVTEDTKIVFGGEESEAAGSTKDLVEGQDVLEMLFGEFEAPNEFPPLEKIVPACPTD